MPMGAVQLKPGVDTQRTLTANQAGVSQSQLIRYKDQMIQTYGGWVGFGSFTINSTIRDLHAWQGIGVSHPHLAIAATQSLSVYHSDDHTLVDITPQTNTTNPTPNFSVSSGSNVITIIDGGSSASIYNTVYFNTPIALGGLLLNGAYPINAVTGSSVYTIISSNISSATIANGGVLPFFNTSSGSATVIVDLPNNNFQSITGLFEQFIAPSSVGGVTIQGLYQIQSVIDSTTFAINIPSQAPATASSTMNGGLAQLVYYVTIGPQPAGGGFGSGGFGLGGFGTGTATTGATGTPITATDWTTDNWGEILLACPTDGAIYTWSPNSGFINAQVIHQAPFFNGGIFISMPQQILVAWRSCQSTGVQDPLIVRWCNAGDYTNWTVSNQTTAGSFTIPNGSRIVGGIQAPTQGVISTDVDVWTMRYIGGDEIFNFTSVGTGCGWIGPHAGGVLAGVVYWCSSNNFYMLGPNGVMPMPCSVWDYIFQNLDTANQTKVKCAVNSGFNEMTWFFPSAGGSGENDFYVKVHIESDEYEWDYGVLPRTAWADVSMLGNPIGADPTGVLFQHETGNAITGVSSPSIRTGWWSISEGNDLSFVDYVIPDFIWGTYGGPKDAQLNVTFYSANYPGDTPLSYGPFAVTQGTEYINTRIRGRLMAIQVQSNNQEFWRLGRVRYRYAPSGRR